MIAQKIIKRISYLVLFTICLTVHANINNLKGTFDVLEDEYKELSVINGAIAYQTAYIMHLYDYGTLGQMRKITMPDQSIVAVPDISNAPELIKLVHLFFHRAPGTIGRGDFVLTDDLQTASDEAKQNVIKAIAWIIVQIKKIEIIESPKFIAGFPQKIKAIRLKGLTIKDELPHLTILANLESSSSITDILQKTPEVLKLFKLIWQSMQQEEGIIAQKTSKSEPIFPKYTTNTVLLAIVYALAGNNKNLIKIFYEKLSEIIISTEKKETELAYSTIFVNDRALDQNWLDEKFNPADKQMLGEQLTFAADNFELLKQYYENIVYLGLLPGELPHEASYIRAYYHYDPSDLTKMVEFSDCMETTIRNIINFLLYIKEKLIFSFTNLPNIDPIPALKDFYQANSDASDTESKYLHEQWMPLVENIDFVVYKHKVGESQQVGDLGKIGYIRVPQGINPGNDYITVESDAILYEVKATLRNFIIIFNHLFQLNLFSNEVGKTQEEKIAAAFVRPDFIGTYFPQLCARLNITLNGFFEGDRNITDVVDSKDYGPEITTKLLLGYTKVNLITKRGHGCIKIEAQNIGAGLFLLAWLNSNHQIIINFAEKFFNNYFFSFPYVAAYKQSELPGAIWNYHIGPSHRFNLFFYLPLSNSDYVNNLVSNLNEPTIQLNEYAIRLLFSLVRTIPDRNQKRNTILNMYAIMVRCPKWNANKGLTNVENSSAQDLINIAIESIKSKTDDVETLGIYLLKALFEKGQGFPEALKEAREASKSQSMDVRLYGRRLFEALKHY